MNKIKKIPKRTSAVFFLGLLLLLGACGEKKDLATETPPKPVTELSKEDASPVFMQIGDDLPVSRGMVAKMLSFLVYDKESINLLKREITFTDSSRELWFDRYINAAVMAGLLSGEGEKFLPEDSLTLGQAQLLLDRLIPENTKKMHLDGNEDTPISYALWLELYMEILEKTDNPSGIFTEKIIVLATPENNEKLKSWHMVTNKGLRAYPGLHMAAYVDTEIKVLSVKDEVIAIIGIENEAPILEKAYVIKTADMGITIFAGGVERTYIYDEKMEIPEKPNTPIADLQIQDGTVKKIHFYEEKIKGTIKKITSQSIEFAEHGLFTMDYNIPVYELENGELKYRQMQHLLVGSKIAEFITTDTEVLAAVIFESYVPDTIRVVLNTTDFTGLYHENVILVANDTITISQGEEVIKKEKGEIVNIEEAFSSWISKGRIYIEVADAGKIQIQSIKRNWSDKESPWYRGRFEISKEKDGYVIVNEVNMEAYLYGVVPSEMPASHGLEAAKIQAITARSYAVNQIFTNRFKHLGAHADDSVSSQVYNNIPENELSIEAVNATKGECLTYEGKVVSTNFFSTSSGVTANSGEVWPHGVTREFPTVSAPYMISRAQHTEAVKDLSIEENAREFFMAASIDAYDYNFPWFRWKVRIPVAEMTYYINKGIQERQPITPHLILVKDANGNYKQEKIESMGELVSFSVIERSKAGNIMTMEFVGTEHAILVHSEYNIRYFLKPQKIEGGEDIIITRKDNSTVKNYTLLPSAFMVFDIEAAEGGTLEAVTFYGGGNGHGVGMSQNGVRGLLDAGFSKEEILNHYYQGTEIKKQY